MNRVTGIVLLLLASLSCASARTFIVMEENHSYAGVIGNPNMPYFNSLAKAYGLAKDYYAVRHPSIGNYFSLTTGQIITNDDTFSSTVYADNIVRHIINAGKTWKEYSECLPYVGYYGHTTGCYIRHHNPCSFFSDVRLSTAQQQNLVPFGQLAQDIASGSLPDWGFIVPDASHNGDNGTLADADKWLKENIEPLIGALDSGDVVVITWDESVDSDKAFGGGHVAWVVVGPGVRKRYRSTNFYQHPNCLQFMCDTINVSCPIPTKSMLEFLQ